MNKFKSFLLLWFAAAFFFAPVSFVYAAEPIDEVRDLIQKYYVEDVPASTLAKPTIQEITSQLDPYSVYMTKQEFERFTNAINQELVGIGVVLEENEQGVKVVQTIPQGPAEQAGILAGDIITNVNGENLQGKSMQTIISYISGEVHTSVTITFLQQSTGLTLTKTIERQKISLPNVEAKILGGDIGYIRLRSFSMDAADQLQTAIQSLHGVKGFIFDLRDNGGGYVSAAQALMGVFPNVQSAFQLRDRSGIPEVYEAIKQTTQFSGPVHLLVNGNSASASEMVSASVKEQKGATLYGQTTYGKGSMQAMFVLSDQSVLKLTIAKFYSPKGTAIHKVGVTPDIATAIGEELSTSHHDQLINLYSQYKKLPALHDVPPTKTFTVKMNVDLNGDAISSKDIQLVHLGGEEVQTELTKLDNRTIKVIPKEPLLAQEKYMLLIHPNWRSKDNQSMKYGAYVDVSVSER